ncbi:MAG TPA: hypothetical protein PK537_05000 [Candidatus Limiplasma sp.]|nr:hypothetical protein [Candidatus Limiplasma sp.]
MPDEVYEVIALAARYWFLFLMILIAWRSYRWYTRDRKKYKKRLKLLPDAGYIGELVVTQGDDTVKKGTCLLVNREGVLGYLRNNDVCLPIDGIANRHLWYSFDDTDGLRVEPLRGRMIVADGEELIGKHKHAFLAHGSTLQVGQAKLRLRMFSGFEYAGETNATRMPLDETEESPIADALDGRPHTDPVRRMHEIAAWQALDEEDAEDEATMDFPEKDDTYGDEAYPPEREDEPDRQFYPPEMDDMDEEDEYDDLPPADDPAYASYEPQHTHPVFYPPVMDDEDPPQPDENGEYPPSMYVGNDEAEQAKRVLWDKYLKGGKRK